MLHIHPWTYFLSKYVGFVAFTILIWDHIDTFPAEVFERAASFRPYVLMRMLQVEYIWKGRKGLSESNTGTKLVID